MTLGGTWTSHGGIQIAAGSAATVPGSLIQTATGVLDLVLAGTNTNQFSRLLITNDANFAGTLRVTLEGGFVPAPLDTFGVVTYGSQTGTFDTEDLPDLGGPLWSTDYGATALTLEVQ